MYDSTNGDQSLDSMNVRMIYHLKRVSKVNELFRYSYFKNYTIIKYKMFYFSYQFDMLL